MLAVQADKTLQLFIKIFYRLGIWQSDEESNFRKIGKKLFYVSFSALFPKFFATNACLCKANRNESIFSVQAAILTAVLYLKCLYLLFKKDEILAFLNDRAAFHSIEYREEYERAKKKREKFIRFVRPYCLAFFITAVLIPVLKLPIFSPDKALPLFISFSWNNSEFIYWLAYLFLSLSTLLYVIINLIAPLIWYIMLNYSIEYELLGSKLSRLGVGKKTVKTLNQKNGRLTTQSSFVEDLVIWMKAHRNLTETVERFRSCFSTLFLGQIVTSGIGICVSVYNLAFENLLQTELYVAVLLYSIFDILLVMYLGNEITVASDRLSYCLFKSNWLEQTESCKKYVLILVEVLKQPQQLYIWIYPLNLAMFMRIINGAYSMFNILKSFQ